MNKTIKSLLILAVIFLLPPNLARQILTLRTPVKTWHPGLPTQVTELAEIPKTMIVTSQREGPAYGMSAGFLSVSSICLAAP